MIARLATVVLRVLLLALALTTLVGIGGEPAPAWAQEELFVGNGDTADSVTVYTRTASGNTAPIRALQGAATGLSNPQDLAVDTVNNELVVANQNDSITVYTRTASGNTAPLRTLSGAATGLFVPLARVVDTVNNELVVANFAAPITVYTRTASGNTAPLRTLTGAATALFQPRAIVVDTVDNEMVVTRRH